jgi:type VI secretion system protein ImpL
MFAGSSKDGALAADVQLAFRVNRAAEVLGDRIIDWEFRSGDQVSRSGAPVPLRWAFGDPVRLMLRFAKDSPEIPMTEGGADARIEGRTVTYTYTDPWALFALLRRHEAEGSNAKRRAVGLMRFVIPVSLDTAQPSIAAAVLSSSPPAARFFIRAEMHAAGTTGSIAVPIAAFPETAPPLRDSVQMTQKE